MVGTLANPVRLDPWQTIRSVSWADAGVHFDGATWLAGVSGSGGPFLSGVSDSALVTGRFRMRVASYADIWNGSGELFAFADADQPVFSIVPGTTDALVADGSLFFTMREAPSGPNFLTVGTAPGVIRLGAWQTYVWSFDTGRPAGARGARLLVDDVLVPLVPVLDFGDPFAINFTDPTLDSVNLGNQWQYTTPLIFDMSRFELWIGTYLDLEPGADLSGAGAPALRFAGDKDSFPLNRGTGGDFTVAAGALQNAGG